MTPALEPLFRPIQYDIVNYRGGKVGVSAVPGSGKTFTLSHLAARLVERLTERGTAEEQEVLVVTFANSAVNTIKARVASILHAQRGMLPYIGYRVRTLHALAHDIVRERPSLVGLAEDFQIVDDRVSAAMLRESVESWVKSRGDELLKAYIDPEAEANEKTVNRIRHNDLPDLALSIADALIRQAKDRRLTPADLRAKLEAQVADLPMARFGADVYESYQRSLSYRGAVDFDDLVRLALLALDADPDYLRRLQRRWPYILEDEAQDSSSLQEVLLRRLSDKQNWVRVGDPNQAINTTFTTANPIFLRNFLKEADVKAFTLDEAGRSARPIIDLANRLVHWAEKQHPVPALRLIFLPQDIKSAPPGDTQGNPSDQESLVHIHYKPGEKITPDRELEIVADSLAKWVPENPNRTVAVLVPENAHGFRLTELLRERDVPYEELLRSTTSTRDAAQRLRSVLDYMAAPAAPSGQEKLARLYRDLWWPKHLGVGGETPENSIWLEAGMNAITHCRAAESFLWPGPGESPLDALELPPDLPDLYADLDAFRGQVMRWLSAAILPIDQLVLTVGQDVFETPSDIALGYKLAQLLRGVATDDPGARLPKFVEELRVISQNERKFLGFDDAEAGYEPKVGRVTVATMHAAKGLEWDRVYLLSVNNYSFPSAQDFDRYLGEKWYVRAGLNLEAEALAQLRCLYEGIVYEEGAATQQFRLDYAAERLRLLYVGITRAKREVLLLWNMGRFYKTGPASEQQPSLPLVALWEYVSGVQNAL